MKTTMPRSDCPISFMLDIVGDRWSLIILRDMMLNGKITYSDFLASNEKIATNILSSRLEHLVNEGMIIRRGSVDNRTKILYVLTDKAMELFPLIREAVIWGAKYKPGGGPGWMMSKFTSGREETIAINRTKMLEEREMILKRMLPEPAETK